MSGIVYDAIVNGQELKFVVGGFWRRNMLMRDLQTGTLWQQATGEAIIGPLAGQHLEPLGGAETTFAAWRAEYPATTATYEPDNAPQSFVPQPLLHFILHTMIQRFAAPGLSRLGRGMDAHETVAGIVVNGEPKAYPLSAFQRQPEIADTLGGDQVVVRYQKNRLQAFRRNGSQLEPIPVARLWWLGWAEFHPGTQVYHQTA
jgi:hypothetical protein